MSAVQKKTKQPSLLDDDPPVLVDVEPEPGTAPSDDSLAKDVSQGAVEEDLPMPVEALNDDSRVEDVSGQSEDPVPDEPAVVEHAEGKEMVGDQFYVLTNRGNLLHWASSGLIGPFEQFEGGKYHDDLLRFTPGHLTVFRGAFGYAVDLVADMDIAQFPVAIEVDPSLVEPVSLVFGEAEGVGQAMGVTTSSIPIAAAKRFIFRSEDELTEFSLREYENAHPLTPMVVESTCFAGDDALSAAEARGLLERAIAGRTAMATPVEFQTADRCAGAVCMVLAVLPAEERFAGELDWIPAATSSVEGLADGLRSLVGETTGGRSGVLDDCLAVLSGLRRAEGWNAVDVHSELAARVLKTKHPSAKALKTQLDYMRRVLDMEATLDLSNQVMGDHALSAALVFLLHPGAGEIQEWLSEESVPDDVAILAAAYSGLVAGMARILADFKPEILMHMLVSYYAGSLHLMSGEAAPCGRISAEFVPTRDVGGEMVFSADSTPFMRREKLSTTAILLGRALDNPAHEETLFSICSDMGWDDCSWHELDVRAQGDVEFSGVESITRIFAGLSMLLQAAKSGLKLRFKGAVKSQASLDEVAFRHRLETEGLSKCVGADYRDFVLAIARQAPANPRVHIDKTRR